MDRVTGHVEVKITELDAEGKVVREFDDTPQDFARVAAATAKQVLFLKMRDVKDDQAKLRLSHISSYKLPTGEILKKKVPLPKNGSYLIIFGGGPAILDDPEMLKLWQNLSSNFLVSDVIFWDDKEVSADFWSLGAGIGQQGNQILQFPNQLSLTKWRNPIE